MQIHRPAAIAAGLALTLTLAAGAAAQAPKAAGPESGTYAVEPTHTRVLFGVDHMGTSTWYGDFTHASGTLKLDVKNPAASQLEVSVPMDSVSTTNTVLDGELKSPDWFDAAKFPTMTFKSTKITVTGPGRANVAGELTLHGVTKPVTLTAELGGFGDGQVPGSKVLGISASTEINRTDFGVGAGIPSAMLSDKIKIELDIEAGLTD
jgi:polyisoprenoid-binding protein YceI